MKTKKLWVVDISTNMVSYMYKSQIWYKFYEECLNER